MNAAAAVRRLVSFVSDSHVETRPVGTMSRAWPTPLDPVLVDGLSVDAFTRRAIRTTHRREAKPVLVYFHPWDLDPDQPRINGSGKSRLRHYRGLRNLETRLQESFRPAPFSRSSTSYAYAKNAQRHRTGYRNQGKSDIVTPSRPQRCSTIGSAFVIVFRFDRGMERYRQHRHVAQLAERYHPYTIEVRGSNPCVPTISSGY